MKERFAEVTINDPVNGDIIGYIYLFENTGEIMAPDAGEKLVLYDFKLTNNGDYFKIILLSVLNLALDLRDMFMNV